MVELVIENVILSTYLGKDLDLERIESAVKNVEYDAEKFPGIVYNSDAPKATILLLPSGRTVCMGAKSLESARAVLEEFAESLRKAEISIEEKLDIKVIDIIASVELGRGLNLTAASVALGAGKVYYEPQKFPGLIYGAPNSTVQILLFQSGKLVCFGATELSALQDAVEQFRSLLRAVGIIS